MTEKHNDFIQRQRHLVDAQMKRDGVMVPGQSILDECLLFKSTTVSINGTTPYQGLLGRNIPMLAEMHPASETLLEDGEDGVEGVSRHIHRLREAALQSIVKGTAEQRTNRALQSRTRLAAQVSDLNVGDAVDFFRAPPNKDISGWRGPATVSDLTNIDSGVVGVQRQGRQMFVRIPDMRRALVLFCLLAAQDPVPFSQVPMRILKEFAEDVQTDSVILSYLALPHGWQLSRQVLGHPQVWHAALHVAACDLGIEGCAGAHVGHGARVLEGISGIDDSLLMWWRAERPSEASWEQMSGTTRVVTSVIMGVDWPNTVFVQFLMVGPEEIKVVREMSPTVPNLGIMDVRMDAAGAVVDPAQDAPMVDHGRFEEKRPEAGSSNPAPHKQSRAEVEDVNVDVDAGAPNEEEQHSPTELDSEDPSENGSIVLPIANEGYARLR